MAEPQTMPGARTTDAQLGAMLAEHRKSVEEFSDRARRIPAGAWLVPRAEGKWTPAEEARHLILTYQAFAGDLRGERKMRLKGTPLLRRIWRVIGLTWIIHRGRIPRAVRAPREVRPEPETGDCEVLMAGLSTEVRAFEEEFTRCWEARPHTTVTHPFFGELNLREALRVATVHTRHHTAFLPDSRRV